MLANDRTRTLMRGIAAGAIKPVQHHQQHHRPQQEQQQQQQQPGDASSIEAAQYRNLGPLGFNTLSFIASKVLTGQHNQQQQQHAKQQQQQQQQQGKQQHAQQVQQQQQADAFGVVEQHPERAASIPRGKLLVPDIPSGSLVLALNLMAYWAITKQARRSSMGGTSYGDAV
jgi:hypothetical protein